MFFRKRNLLLEFNKFSVEKNIAKVFQQAAIWHEIEWGYLHHIKEEYFNLWKNNFYIVKHNNLYVGMFKLVDHIPIDKKTKIKHLSFVFVDPSFREAGIGNQIIQKAKEIAKKDNATLITRHTLNPMLNKFYQKQGAKIVCDASIGINPTTFLRINI